ncbi:MAG: 2-C-methyl-D-erythritol 4-phosphate cytidylyltransferase, partial [Xanthobacteraceae bacterium]|nr:2-C-methyl-D-erythritol 4-phosphate cytidylyltransferase [Xanthobacteraceae bacterium]
MCKSMTEVVAAVVVAAGRGTRAGGARPKQYQEFRGVPVIRTAIAA